MYLLRWKSAMLLKPVLLVGFLSTSNAARTSMVAWQGVQLPKKTGCLGGCLPFGSGEDACQKLGIGAIKRHGLKSWAGVKTKACRCMKEGGYVLSEQCGDLAGQYKFAPTHPSVTRPGCQCELKTKETPKHRSPLDMVNSQPHESFVTAKDMSGSSQMFDGSQSETVYRSIPIMSSDREPLTSQESPNSNAGYKEQKLGQMPSEDTRFYSALSSVPPAGKLSMNNSRDNAAIKTEDTINRAPVVTNEDLVKRFVELGKANINLATLPEMRALTTRDFRIVWHSVMLWSSSCSIYCDLAPDGVKIEGTIERFYIEYPPVPVKDGSERWVTNSDGTITLYSTIIYMGSHDAQAIFTITNGSISKIELGKKDFSSTCK